MDDWFADDRTALPEELAGRIKPELAPGERLLWAARSRPWLRSWTISLANWLWIVVSGLVAILGLAAGFGLLGPTLRDTGAVAIMLGELAVPFFLGSCAFAINAWVTDRGWINERLETSYALTSSRAIVWRPDRERGGLEIFSYYPGTFRQVHRRENPDGSGDVTFSPIFGFDLLQPPKGFAGVADVARVEGLVRGKLLVEPAEDPIPVDYPLRGPRRWEAGQVDAGGG